MATAIDKSVTRRCPGITNDYGRQLDARLDNVEDGSITLKWVGLRSTAEQVFSLRDLIEFAEETPGEIDSPENPDTHASDDRREKSPKSPGAGYIQISDLLSKLHIEPMDIHERERLVSLIEDIREHRDWLNDPSGDSLEVWKEKQQAREGGDE